MKSKYDDIPLLNVNGGRKKKNSMERTSNDETNIHILNRHTGQFQSSTGFLRKIFLGISCSILGLGSIFTILAIINIVNSGDEDSGHSVEVMSDDYAKNIYEISNNSNLNVPDGKLLAPFLVERLVDTPSHKEVQEFMVNHFTKLNWDIEKDEFIDDTTPFGSKKFTNYIFTKNKQASHRIVLAAHYDSKFFENQVFIGATDSSVPCAILLDIAETLNSKLEQQLAKLKESGNKDALKNSTTIQMIFFDGEEAFKDWTKTDSLYGSRHLADQWENETLDSSTTLTKLKSIDVLVLLDLLGTPMPKLINFYAATENYFNALAEIEELLYKNQLISTSQSTSQDTNTQTQNSYTYFTKSAGINKSNTVYIDDDHRPFLNKGVPILHIIPNPFPKVWHKLSDNASALDEATIKDLALLFKLFVAKQLNLTD